MIQRIQTIFLAVAALVFLAPLLFIPLVASESMPWIGPTVAGINALVALGAIGSIFLYANRKQQLKAVTWLQFLSLLGVVAVIGGVYLSGVINHVPGNTAAIVLLVIPLVGYVLIRMAAGSIKKDIELVRSADRLRP